MPAANRLVGDHVETKAGIIETPSAVKQRSGRHTQRRRNGKTTKMPLTRQARHLDINGLRTVAVIPLVGPAEIVPR